MMTFEEYVKFLVERFQVKLRLQEWQPYIFYPEKLDGDREGQMGEIEINVPYLFFKLSMGPNARSHFESKSYEEVARSVMHELCHIITEPLCLLAAVGTSHAGSKQLSDADEAATQRIARALFAALDPKEWMPRRKR